MEGTKRARTSEKNPTDQRIPNSYVTAFIRQPNNNWCRHQRDETMEEQGQDNGKSISISGGKMKGGHTNGFVERFRSSIRVE